MKTMLLLIVLTATTTDLFSQDQDLQILNIKKERLINAIAAYNDSLTAIHAEIARLQKQDNESKDFIIGFVYENNTLIYNDEYGSIIGYLQKKDTVKIYDVKGYYFQIASNDQVGYVPVGRIKQTWQVQQFYDEKQRKAEEKSAAEAEAKRNKENAERERQYEAQKKKEQQKELARKQKREQEIRTIFASYGADVVNKIINGQYWIGMTSQMAQYSLGKPKNINSSVGAWGTKEQWVYYNLNLYFENGELTSYQKAR